MTKQRANDKRKRIDRLRKEEVLIIPTSSQDSMYRITDRMKSNSFGRNFKIIECNRKTDLEETVSKLGKIGELSLHLFMNFLSFLACTYCKVRSVGCEVNSSRRINQRITSTNGQKILQFCTLSAKTRY